MSTEFHICKRANPEETIRLDKVVVKLLKNLGYDPHTYTNSADFHNIDVNKDKMLSALKSIVNDDYKDMICKKSLSREREIFIAHSYFDGVGARYILHHPNGVTDSLDFNDSLNDIEDYLARNDDLLILDSYDEEISWMELRRRINNSINDIYENYK